MKTLSLNIELYFDDDLMYGSPVDAEAQEWFFNDILLHDNLHLFSDEVGDIIGSVKVIDIKG